jgi:hypothetical protein
MPRQRKGGRSGRGGGGGGRGGRLMAGRGLANVMHPTPKKRGAATKSIYAGMESRRLCLCVGDPATCFGEPYGLPTAFPNSPAKARGAGYSMLRKKKKRQQQQQQGGGKKLPFASPERGGGPNNPNRKKLSPIQQQQLATMMQEQHSRHLPAPKGLSSVAPSGRVAGPSRIQHFESRDILTPYAPLSSLNPEGRHEARRRGHAQQVVSNEVKLQQMIDQMHASSIQDLPWQARACPQALEAREAARLRAACRNEKRRVQAWRQLEQSRAMEAAEREVRTDQRSTDEGRKERTNDPTNQPTNPPTNQPISEPTTRPLWLPLFRCCWLLFD